MLGVVVVGAAQVDAVALLGDLERLLPLARVLVELVEHFELARLEEDLLRLLVHVEVDGEDGHLHVLGDLGRHDLPHGPRPARVLHLALKFEA